MAVESRLGHCNFLSCSDPLVAIDARWLWNRDDSHVAMQAARKYVAIDARWLWNRDGCRLPSRGSRTLGRDRCSMAVESRPLAAAPLVVPVSVSRSMLDGCGIETSRCLPHSCPAPGRRDRCSMAVESRHLEDRCGGRADCPVAIDARWLWNRDMRGQRPRRGTRSVAIDARWLWNRDKEKERAAVAAYIVAIDARWLWNRDT